MNTLLQPEMKIVIHEMYLTYVWRIYESVLLNFDKVELVLERNCVHYNHEYEYQTYTWLSYIH